MIEINEENYFDIAEALHTVMTLWHDGGHGYEIKCKSQFKPSPSWNETTVMQENEYYEEVNSLVENDKGEFLGYDEIEKLMDALNVFVATRD